MSRSKDKMDLLITGKNNYDSATLINELNEKQKQLEEKNRELYLTRKQLEACLTEYNKIYQNSPTSYFSFNKDGIIIELNATGADCLGTTKEFLLTKKFENFVIPEHREQFQIHLNNVFTFRKRQSCELKIERKDKSVFYALLESIPSNYNGNDDVICLTAVSDITMLKVAEEALRESEARFQNVANTAPVLIWITDADALFTFVNNFWLQYTGRSLGQELGMNWIEGIHPEDLDKFLLTYKTAFDARTPFETDFRFKKHDGTYRWIIAKGVPRFLSDGRFAGFIGSCTDINDQKVIEEKIKSFNEELKSLNASKDKFFSIIAHDLKSPLSGVLGFAEILIEDYDELDDKEIKEFIEHIHQAAQNLNELLENLLDWSRIQTGRLNFELVKLNLDSTFHDIISLFYQNALNKNIKLEKLVDDNLNVLADKNSIKTILRNLVSNGIKFTQSGGTVSLLAEEKDEMILITVQDSGIGISKENINKLFKVDINYSTPGTNNERGTGLGLVLCKELVEKNGGNIWVESEIGKGTKFIFTLPRA